MRWFWGIAMVLGLAAEMPAEAAIVSNWAYSIETVWTAATPSGNPPWGVDLTSHVLSWGEYDLSDRSSLTIKTEPSGTVITYVGSGLPGSTYQGNGSTLVHHNEPVSGTTLTVATLTTSLHLYDPVTHLQASLVPMTLSIQFKETPNQTPCAVASATPCRDIFAISAEKLLQNQYFNYAGQYYYVNLYPIMSTGSGMNWLSNAACATVGLTTGASGKRCAGFTTEENHDTQMKFGFTVSTQPLTIPEPGALALVGIALIGLGRLRFWRR